MTLALQTFQRCFLGVSLWLLPLSCSHGQKSTELALPGLKQSAEHRGRSQEPSHFQASAKPLLASSPKKTSVRKGKFEQYHGQKPGPRLLFLGDSLVSGISRIVGKKLTDSLGGQLIVHAKTASGLARPDYFNWPVELEKNFSAAPYDLAIIIMGTNDGQSFMDDGKLKIYGTEPWIQSYRKRMKRMMAQTCSGAQRLLWLGLPPMRSSHLQSKVNLLNGIAAEEAAKNPCARYISMDKVVGTKAGTYARDLKFNNQIQRVRTSDGIHYSMMGGHIVAQTILAESGGMSGSSESAAVP